MPVDLNELYVVIGQAIVEVWEATWPYPEVPVYWDFNDAQFLPDPLSGAPAGTAHFFRNGVDFGAEEIETLGAFGNHLRVTYGSVILRIHTARLVGEETQSLRLMGTAMNVFRGYRRIYDDGCDLSFIGSGAGQDYGPSDDGNWSIRGFISVFQYRFPG